ncbi:hypothetical protein A6A04_19425 [Paramagnetospirillum marisnigri]|uniref:Ryanodine receptor Ryr domain-containing protein n=2 Tax=Paramagnetospirillum marisnigri TaxID=1285242 RepID=A0A178MN10_9PROT|nr:hypothetical protein A6A04_19425 [Paramagnetospirillum marisnigri]
MFAERFPGHARIGTPQFLSADVESDRSFLQLWHQLFDQPVAPTVIYACMDKPELCLATVLTVETHLRREGHFVPPIMAFDPKGDVARGLAAATETSGMIESFGRQEAMFSPELVLQDNLDRLARTVHEGYVEERLRDGEQLASRPTLLHWDALTESVRDDNRAATDHHGLKVRELGAVLCPSAERFGFPPVPEFSPSPEALEELAIAEHNRWCANRYLAGWHHAKTRDDARFLHPDLVEYQALTEAAKNKDREQVKAIPALFRMIGMDVVLPHHITVTAGTETATLDAAARQELAATLARWQHPAFVLSTGLSSPAERQACLMALEFGGHLRLRLAEPSQSTLRRLPEAERAEVRRILGLARHILAAPPGEVILPNGIALRVEEPGGTMTDFSSPSLDTGEPC